MKQRLIAVVLLAALLCSFLALPVAADTTVYITSTGSKYHNSGCRYLDESRHEISLTTAIAQGYTACSVCNAPTAGAHTHTWDNGAVTMPPTCTQAGTIVYHCTTCTASKTEAIAATGVHTWDSGAVTLQPTCTEAGIRLYRCTACGLTRNETIAAYGAHSWDAGVVTTAATATTDGVMSFTCQRCGEKKTERISALGYPFSDVPSTQYCWLAVKWADENGITKGTDATHFSPNQVCTRAQTVTFLWRANGCPEPELYGNPFSDLNTSAFYYKAVLWAYENGITTGTDQTHFSPNAIVTRGQTLTFMWRVAGSASTQTSSSFADVQPGSYYYDAVLWAVAGGVTNGTDATHFSPASGCTRGQIVTFLYRHDTTTLTKSAYLADCYQILNDYSGCPYVTVHQDIPYFTAAEHNTKAAFECYGALDSLGRCTYAYACLDPSTMPPDGQERGEIGQIKPTGWHTIRYNDYISGSYLYNRCHMIAWCLSAENANEKNLLTGTRYLNIDGMNNVIELPVAKYIDRTGNHVLYRVTPLFVGDELVCRGVLMEGYSVEDAGAGISFCRFFFNVQPGIAIDYATGDSSYSGIFLDPSASTVIVPAQRLAA